MLTAATLTIDHFRTTLTLSYGQPGPGVRLNVLGEGEWRTDCVTYFRTAADRLIGEYGYERDGEWLYDASRDTHTATINRP